MPSIVANIGLPLDPGGALSFAAPLPSVPFTFSFTMQAFCIDPSTQLGASSTNGVQVTLNPNPVPAGLVINEVDYDQPNTDTTEFIEILNPTSNTIPLTGISLALVNGSNNASYQVLDLSSLGSLVPVSTSSSVRPARSRRSSAARRRCCCRSSRAARSRTALRTESRWSTRSTPR
jgi:hypothetical protein